MTIPILSEAQITEIQRTAGNLDPLNTDREQCDLLLKLTMLALGPLYGTAAVLAEQTARGGG